MPSDSAILLVENDSDLLATLSRKLIRRGFTVTLVKHPRQALEAASFKRFQVAVVDHRLPERSGSQLTRQLKLLVADLQAGLSHHYRHDQDIWGDIHFT